MSQHLKISNGQVVIMHVILNLTIFSERGGITKSDSRWKSLLQFMNFMCMVSTLPTYTVVVS